ncbi:hypothetical protein ACTMU2_24895 [Cupriavidus basilensis]
MKAASIGTLQVLRTQDQLNGAAMDIAVLEEAGVPYQLLSREELAAKRTGAGRRQP